MLEHFDEHDLARGLREMALVLKPGGRLVVLVPSAEGVFYVAGKGRQEAEGRWEYGVERPQTSLRPLAAPLGLELVEERLIGVRWQARFLDGWRRSLANGLLAPFSETSRVGAAMFGGYLLLSSWCKPEAV